MEFLTQNAVRVPPNGFINHRQYLKHGGYRQALADFTALQPDDIHSVKQTGNVSCYSTYIRNAAVPN